MENARCNGSDKQNGEASDKVADILSPKPPSRASSFRLQVDRRFSESSPECSARTSPFRLGVDRRCSETDSASPTPSPLRLSIPERRKSTSSGPGSISPGSEQGSRIPVRSPASTPTMPRRSFGGFTMSKYNRHSQSLRSLDRVERDPETESLGGRSSSCAGDCDHAHFPANGTTFSGRTKKYVIHCSPKHCGSEPEEYLTPTQRANATIRRLRHELQVSQAELSEREREITRLTKEIVQLRLRRLDDNEDDPHVEQDQGIITGGAVGGFRPIKFCSNEVTSLGDGPSYVIATIPPSSSSSANQGSSSSSEVPPSLVDSGHFEELSPYNSPRTSALEKEIDRLKAEHESEIKQIKGEKDLKLSELMKKLSDANQRCEELKPQLEDAQRKLSEMEKEKEKLMTQLAENEERHKDDYVKVFNKGKQAAIVDSGVSDGDGPPRDIPSLLQQLEVTRQELNSVRDCDYWEAARKLSAKEAVSIWNLSRKTMYRHLLENKKSQPEQDAEVTLKFLKSAIFYFLTDRENATGHLAAIQSILGFNEDEKAAIDKNSYLWKY